MPDPTLDGWLTGITRVVSALTANEERLVFQLQRLRRDGQTESPHLESPYRFEMVGHFGRPEFKPPPPTTTPTDPAPIRFDDAIESKGEYSVQIPSPTRSSFASQQDWPVAPDEAPATSPAMTRDYNYFAELDKKLENLRQRVSTS